MLECFNHGDLHVYDALCNKHAAVLNAQPALVENERRLREKVGGILGYHEVSCSTRSNTASVCRASIGIRLDLQHGIFPVLQPLQSFSSWSHMLAGGVVTR